VRTPADAVDLDPTWLGSRLWVLGEYIMLTWGLVVSGG
jgi:hypothetical protein